MSLIITATDFSDVAEHAVRYACQLAQMQKAKLLIVHSYIVPVAFNESPMPVMPIDEAKQIATERMAGLMEQLTAEYEGLDISNEILYGDITDALQEYATDLRPWLIVVGNSGHNDTFLWLGSNLLSALRNLSYPVLAVPPDAKFSPVKKICFACDFKNVAKHLPAGLMTDVVKALGAELHVLNIDHENRSFGVETPYESEALHEKLKALNPQYHYLEHENTDAAIQSFIDANNIDWLLVLPHRHSFFESIFHKSHTKAMVKMSHIPVLALHEEENR